MPTVIVARTPVPGREDEFEAWLRRLVAAARVYPGHVHSDIQPPNDVHPGEWVILYQFATAESLEAWLTSDTRLSIMAEGDDLITGPQREQVIALAQGPEPVTAVASFRVQPGNEDRYAEFHQRLLARLEAFPGFLRSELFVPVEGVQDETVVVFAFDSRQHLDAWLGSDERRHMLAEIEPYLDGERTINVVGGFAGWFGAPGMANVKRWKQGAMVLLAIFPTTLVVTRLRMIVLPDVHWVLGVLIGNVLGVIALTWLLMPRLTRWFAGWLRR
jgi:antibiotic biosynthesis monooxygenase (ABM) superfamily enzyme